MCSLYNGASSHLSMEAGAVANPTRFWPCALDRQLPGAFGFETVRFKEPRGPHSQPVEKLLDVDGTDIDERIFAIVWSRLLPDYQLIEAIEVDRRGALTAQCHAGIAAPVEFVVILLRLRAGA
jgi:hypothetical protein